MITILDGGMGRELERMGAPFRQPEWSALALMETPDAVRDAHLSYVQAGAEVLTTNAYACVPFHIGEERFADQGRDLIALAGKLAREAADTGDGVRVAGCIPPLFGSYNPQLFDAARAPDILMPLIEEQAPYVDFWLVETLSSVEEALFVTEALAKTGKPIWLAFTLRDYYEDHPPQLRSRELLSAALTAIKDLPIEAVLFNCSQPETMTPALQIAATQLDGRLRLGVYANAFDDIRKGHKSNEVVSALREDLIEDTSTYLEFCQRWIDLGARIIGGCCGIGPAHIKALCGLK